ncbi:MAG: hypothetical protein RIT43_589 [Bacteroidota bacterium]
MNPRMKKPSYPISLFQFSFLALIVFLALSSCSGSDNAPADEESEDEYYEFKGLNLKEYSIPAMIMLPDETANIGASTKPEVVHNDGDFVWDIYVGPNFELHIEDYGDYTDLVEYKKKELKKQEVFEIDYLVNEKDLIVYESTLIVRGSKEASPTVGVKHKSYHVYAQKTINGITYELRSRDEGYERVIIDLMAKSVKSFKPIK